MINCGSSSIKAAVVDPRDGDRVVTCRVERIGESGASLRLGEWQLQLGEKLIDHDAALAEALPRLLKMIGEDVTLRAVGHRERRE